MIDDLLADISALHAYAASIARLVGNADEIAPQSGTGTDRSGLIRVKVDANGIPISVRIDQHWQRAIAPRKLGASIVAGSHAAVANRLRKWSRILRETGWEDEVDRLRRSKATPPPAAPPRPVEPERTRPIDVVAEDLIKAFDAIAELPASGPRDTTGSGRDRTRNVAITVSRGGLVSCEVDGAWAAGRSAASLMNAIGEALTAARAELVTLDRGAGAATPTTLDGLFGEALALLRAPQRMRDR